MSFVARDISKSYQTASHVIDVLKGVSFDLEMGQSLAILGQSGVGKSTLLHCLGLLETCDRGDLILNGESISIHDSSQRVESRRRKIGFVFQFHYLMSELTALENVMIPLALLKFNEPEIRQRAEAILNQVGLGERLHHRPFQLSGGEQQRVSIARALVHKPTVILADEPTGNLDPETAHRVFDVLNEQCQKQGAALIMATHNYELANRLQRRAKLDKGALQWL